MASDMASRWIAAKLGPVAVKQGKRMCVVHVECDTDPRTEVLQALEGDAMNTIRTGQRVADVEAPKRKRAKKGGEE